MAQEPYDPAVRQKVLDGLTEGKGLNLICKADGMPSRETVRLWCKDDPDFADAVGTAREEGYHALAEKTLHEAETEVPKDKAAATAARLKFDARRWYLGKLSNAFSDKQKHELTGKDGAPIETKSKLDVGELSDDQLRALASIKIQSE